MRSYNRFATDETITCSIGGAAYSAGLYNLSCGGCMIEIDSDDALTGANVELAMGKDVVMPGRIVWRIEKNAGIKFDIPLHSGVVAQFGYFEDEDFDRDDPRDRFGIPLVERLHQGAGHIG